MKELIDALRLGATISRERGIYQDYCLIADHAADAIERLERDLVAADIRIGNDTLELDALDAMLDKARYALDYASDMTKPDGLGGCDCPICTVLREMDEMKGGVE